MIRWLTSRLGVLFRTILALALVSVQLPVASQAQIVSVGAGRLALVVGNSNYKNIPDLKNPERDAALISSTLRGLGFDVVEKTDLDRNGFEAAVSETLEKAAGKNAVLFYFAGHGFQLAGRNYLVPTDASLTDKSRIPEETLSLDELIGRLQSRDRQTLLLLDACRNNPLPQSSREALSSDGLAQIETGSGTFVAFATQPGNITNDGAGDNSPFSVALAEHMPTEGISISDMMIRVRNTVEETTLERQTPWDQSSLRSQFYFNPLEEDSDALTDEDLELLAELDPELLEKFKKRFGLNYNSSDDNDAQTGMVATVVPALRIEAADETPPEIVSVEPMPAPGTDQEVAIRATPELQTDGSIPDPASDIAAPEPQQEIAALEHIEPKPSLLISGVAEPESLEPALGTEAAIDLAGEEGDLDTENRTPLIGAETIPEDTDNIAGNEPTLRIPIPLKRPLMEPDVEIALADPRPILEPAPVPAPKAPITVGPEIDAPDLPATPLVIEPAAPRVNETVDAEEPLPEAIGPSVPASKDIAAQMPEFTPSEQLSKAPVLVLSAPGLITDAADPSAEKPAAANVPSATPSPEASGSAETPPNEGLAPTLTPTIQESEPETPVELASLGPPAAGDNSELELPPESPLPDPAPVVDLEEQRRSLATRAQTELQRLGCYRSAIDGDWGPRSARALLRYYAEQKLTPDETEPTEALISMLSGESTVICKTTVKAKPAVAPAKKKNTVSAPAPKKQPQAAKPVAKRTAPAKKSAAAAPASTKKKLKGSNMIGAFR